MFESKEVSNQIHKYDALKQIHDHLPYKSLRDNKDVKSQLVSKGKLYIVNLPKNRKKKKEAT